jgi:hypothetical protein
MGHNLNGRILSFLGDSDGQQSLGTTDQKPHSRYIEERLENASSQDSASCTKPAFYPESQRAGDGFRTIPLVSWPEN